MDYNIAIISLGGVERILAPGPLTLTDAELEAHIAHNVIGTKHSVSDVKAQVLVLEQEVNKSTYKAQRAMAYKPLAEQLDMQYWDRVNGTDTWKQHIDAVKTAHPKPTE